MDNNSMPVETQPSRHPAPSPPPGASEVSTAPFALAKEAPAAAAPREKPRPVKQPAKSGFETLVARHEAKYIIPASLVPQIREFARPFCKPDSNCKGNPPEYVVTTLQLDGPSLPLHHAKEDEALNRFKLRARIYGEPGQSPVYCEVKQKYNGIIVKWRAPIPASAWGEHLIRNRWMDVKLRSRKEETAFLMFVRLAREIGAEPAVLIRYTRESYVGAIDHYARVTFDRNLLYQPTRAWDTWGRGGKWISMDTNFAQGQGNSFSGVVLELKTLNDAPRWMIDLVMEFNLERLGNCKYSTAVWMESLFRGTPPRPLFSDEIFE